MEPVDLWGDAGSRAFSSLGLETTDSDSSRCASAASEGVASTADTVDAADEDARPCDEWHLFEDDSSACSSARAPASQREDPEDPTAREPESSTEHEAADGDTRAATPASQRDEPSDTEADDVRDSPLAMAEKPEVAVDGRRALAASVEASSRPVTAADSDCARAEPSSTSKRTQVFVRVRPAMRSEGGESCVSRGDSATSVRVHSSQGHSVTDCVVDRLFSEAATQDDVFAAVQPSVDAAFAGYNATVFAYGQTGTGKTHTMFGDDLDSLVLAGDRLDSNPYPALVRPSWGVIPRALAYLLGRRAVAMREDNSVRIEMRCSFVQIYNERLFDLLTDRRRQRPLAVREQPSVDGSTSVVLQGLSTQPVETISDALQFVRKGRLNRSVRETEMNATSSRSHAIVQINLLVERSTGDRAQKRVRRSRLNIVDLAGSEKWNTELEMEERHSSELKNINASLSALGNCIAALAEAGRKHIPYRDSTLTRVLQDSLGGHTQTCLIATISPSPRHADETVRTLQFADRARSVLQVVRLNDAVSGDTELAHAKAQISRLRQRLESEQRRRRETRLQEHDALQRDFAEQLQAKDEVILKLTRDNEVFAKWRDEDKKTIRSLETRLKDVESQLELSRRRSSAVEQEQEQEQEQEEPEATADDSSGEDDRVVDNQQHSAVVHRPTRQIRHAPPGALRPTEEAVRRRRKRPDEKLSERDAPWATEPAEALRIPSIQRTTDADQNHMRRSLTQSVLTTSPDKQRALARVLSESMVQVPASYERSPAPAESLAPTQRVFKTSSPRDFAPSTDAGELRRALPSQVDAWNGATPMSKLPLLQQAGSHLLTGVDQQVRSPSEGAFSTSLRQQQQPAADAVASRLFPAAAGHSSDVCVRHSLKGCVLCGSLRTDAPPSKPPPFLTAPFQPRSTQAPPASTQASAAASPGASLSGAPCERHLLPGCFICHKSSTVAPARAIPTAAKPFAGLSASSPAGSYQVLQGGSAALTSALGSGGARCDAHFLPNCALCHASAQASHQQPDAPASTAQRASNAAAFDVAVAYGAAPSRYAAPPHNPHQPPQPYPAPPSFGFSGVSSESSSYDSSATRSLQFMSGALSRALSFAEAPSPSLSTPAPAPRSELRFPPQPQPSALLGAAPSAQLLPAPHPSWSSPLKSSAAPLPAASNTLPIFGLGSALLRR
ncbi:hypothetical protein ATCC90586_007870 [Pythium insidiosum]|nr:hypothetical protein ATCC90586_007870 [Pythium insidiosum]